MSENIPQQMPEDLTRKWLALAERRRAHLAELYDSGRWKHYYSEGELIARMRDTVRLAETWAGLAGEGQKIAAE